MRWYINNLINEGKLSHLKASTVQPAFERDKSAGRKSTMRRSVGSKSFNRSSIVAENSESEGKGPSRDRIMINVFMGGYCSLWGPTTMEGQRKVLALVWSSGERGSQVIS